VGFEPTIPKFELEKTFHASDRAATVTGFTLYKKRKNVGVPVIHRPETKLLEI
jgi:hypothetical protein